MNPYLNILITVITAWCSCAKGNDTIPDINKWDFSLAGNIYLLPDDTYFNPVFSAGHNHLHLEARYNYEDLRTASVFGGYHFSTGVRVELNATPILGVVFGNTNGLAPGLLLDVYYRKINLHSESEYLIDFEENNDSFIYTWSELTIALKEWLWVGLAAQRTRLYQAKRDIQRGFTAGFSRDVISVGGYIFNIDQKDPYGVLTLEIQF
jgi:hypothetical protein